MNFLKAAESIHMIGMGGIGMSGLARLLQSQGKKVAGSDLHASETTRELTTEGFQIHIGHSAENLPENTDIVIFSEAIPESNPELQKAKELGILCMNYFEALGEFAQDYRVIAIAGTHGKSTTTAMLALILLEAGLDPTILVGSNDHDQHQLDASWRDSCVSISW